MLVSHIRGEDLRLAARFTDRGLDLLQSVNIASHQRHGGAGRGQRPGHRLSQATAATSNERSVSGEINLHAALLGCNASVAPSSRNIQQVAASIDAPAMR